jgi:FkbM family methyltransferase
LGQILCFGGNRFVLSGREGDPYYDHLEQHAIGCSEIELAARILDPEAIVFDVGANIGLTTLAFASIASEGRVFAFEPLSRSFQYLNQNVFANRAGSARMARVEAINAGCGSATGVGRLLEDSFSAGSFLIADRSGDLARSGVDVEIVRLDDVAQQQELSRLDFVKIDVEGFELDVVAGMGDILTRFAPIVCLEFNSFCLIANAEVLPTTLLAQLCSRFERVAVAADSGLRLLSDAGDRRTALAANLTQHGGMDNLICFPTAEQYEAALRRAGRLGLDTCPTYVAQPNDKAGVTIELSRRFAGRGWSGREVWGAWSDEPQAAIHVDLRGMQAPGLELRAWMQGFLPAGQAAQQVSVTVNDEPVTTWEIGESMAHPHVAYVPGSLARRQHPMTIAFNRDDRDQTPAANTGQRRGIACRCIELNPTGPSS